MAIKLEKVYHTLKNQYQLRIVAGKAGLLNLVEWVHIVEHVSVVPYLRSNELVITTGVAMDAKKELFDFCAGLSEREVSGLVVNLGPYIEKIPQKVVELCDKKELPLITLPWEMQLTDLGRDLHKMILKTEKFEEIIVETFKDAVFYPNQMSLIIPTLEREGFPVATQYSLIMFCRQKKVKDDSELETVCRIIKRIVNKISERYILFVNDGIITLALVDFNKKSRAQMIDEFIDMCKSPQNALLLVIGPAECRIRKVSEYYGKMVNLLKFADRTGQAVVSYDDLDVYKILLSVDDQSVLKEMYQKNLEKLERYDADNHTNYFALLKDFFLCGFSRSELANKLYIHRNTVQYQLSKIEEILACDLKDPEDLFRLHLCLYIKDVLQ